MNFCFILEFDIILLLPGRERNHFNKQQTDKIQEAKSVWRDNVPTAKMIFIAGQDQL